MIVQKKSSEIVIDIVGVWNYSYNFGLENFAKRDITIGQEYHIKDVYIGSNSTYLIKYHDNDVNMTEKTMIPTNYANVNFTISNSSIMRLEKVDGDVQYWNVYFEYYKNMTDVNYKKWLK
jgi:hypothetical protein